MITMLGLQDSAASIPSYSTPVDAMPRVVLSTQADASKNSILAINEPEARNNDIVLIRDANSPKEVLLHVPRQSPEVSGLSTYYVPVRISFDNAPSMLTHSVKHYLLTENGRDNFNLTRLGPGECVTKRTFLKNAFVVESCK